MIIILISLKAVLDARHDKKGQPRASDPPLFAVSSRNPERRMAALPTKKREREHAAEEPSSVAAMDAEPSNGERALRSMLQCPVCYCMMAPPITQCQQGHALCASCFEGVGRCPTCRVELPARPIRSLALEQLAASVRVTCEHEHCGTELAYGAYARHAAACDHRPFRCPFARSAARGPRRRPAAPAAAAAPAPDGGAGDTGDADDDDAGVTPPDVDEAHVVREMERYIAEIEGGRAEAEARAHAGAGAGGPRPAARGPPAPPVTRPTDPDLARCEDLCDWRGRAGDCVDHLVNSHGVHVERAVDVLDDGVRYLLEDAEGGGECTWGPWLARDARGRTYLLRVEQRNGALFAAGQLVGSDAALAAARDASVVLKITAFSPTRNLSYEGPPTSLRSDFRSLRRSGDGLWLSKGQVALLSEAPPRRPPAAGRRAVRLTVWFETVAAGDPAGDPSESDGEPAGPRQNDVDDADLEAALAPMHVSRSAPPPRFGDAGPNKDGDGGAAAAPPDGSRPPTAAWWLEP